MRSTKLAPIPDKIEQLAPSPRKRDPSVFRINNFSSIVNSDYNSKLAVEKANMSSATSTDDNPRSKTESQIVKAKTLFLKTMRCGLKDSFTAKDRDHPLFKASLLKKCIKSRTASDYLTCTTEKTRGVKHSRVSSLLASNNKGVSSSMGSPHISWAISQLQAIKDMDVPPILKPLKSVSDKYLTRTQSPKKKKNLLEKDQECDIRNRELRRFMNSNCMVSNFSRLNTMEKFCLDSIDHKKPQFAEFVNEMKQKNGLSSMNVNELFSSGIKRKIIKYGGYEPDLKSLRSYGVLGTSFLAKTVDSEIRTLDNRADIMEKFKKKHTKKLRIADSGLGMFRTTLVLGNNNSENGFCLLEDGPLPVRARMKRAQNRKVLKMMSKFTVYYSSGAVNSRRRR